MLVAACGPEHGPSAPNFTVTTDPSVTIEDAVAIHVRNDDSDPICIPAADLEVPGATIHLLPPSREDFIENRAPPTVMKGIDLSSGLDVILGKGTHDFYLDLTKLKYRRPLPTSVNGALRAVRCESLFRDPRLAVTVRRYSIRIVH
jgi:hypothetical protein